MKPGDIEMKKGFLYNQWDVFTGIEDNVKKAVRFKNFENAQIFSQLVKLNDASRGK